jgi:hypothetical protein
MRWWKKSRFPDLSPESITSRIRGFFLDSQMPSAHHMSVIMGCSPISEEVAEHEEEDSEARVDKIDHLIPILYAFAHTMAQASVEHQLAHLEDDSEDEDSESLLSQLPPEIWEASQNLFTQVSMSTLIGTISQLVDMGFLKVGTPSHVKKVFKL